MKKNIKNIIFITAGILSSVTGFLGAMLPILPSVPFWILSASMFMRGIPPLNRLVKKTRIYQRFFKRFSEGHGMTVGTKTVITVFVWLMMGSVFLTSSQLWLKIIAIVLPLMHTVAFIFIVKTDKKLKNKTEQE